MFFENHGIPLRDFHPLPQDSQLAFEKGDLSVNLAPQIRRCQASSDTSETPALGLNIFTNLLKRE